VREVGAIQGLSTVGVFLFCRSLPTDFHQPDPINSGQEDGRADGGDQVTKGMDANERKRERNDRRKREITATNSNACYMLHYYKVF
jgi:hypothetical protein